MIGDLIKLGVKKAGRLEDAVSEAAPSYMRWVQSGFDPRFDPRVKEAQRLANLKVESTITRPDVPSYKLSEFEGRPFVTSMSDRTAGGETLRRINDVEIDPIHLLGGQDYMFDPLNTGQVWASALTPVRHIMGLGGELKRATGADPLFMPWRMAPTGGDFAHMTGETMLAYASAAMNKTNKRKLDRMIKKQIPDWPGVDAPDAISKWRDTSDVVRKQLKNDMDVNFRDRGGLSIGEARLAVADPTQLTAPDVGLMNVGVIDPGRGVIEASGHPSYPVAVPGEGIGRLHDAPLATDLIERGATRFEGDVGGFVTSDWGLERGVGEVPDRPTMRAMQMKPYGGVIDEPLLRRLKDRGYDVGALIPGAVGLGALSAAGGAEASPEERYGTIRQPAYPALHSATMSARGLQDRMQGSPLSWLFPEGIVTYAERIAMGDEPTWGERLGVALDLL